MVLSRLDADNGRKDGPRRLSARRARRGPRSRPSPAQVTDEPDPRSGRIGGNRFDNGLRIQLRMNEIGRKTTNDGRT